MPATVTLNTPPRRGPGTRVRDALTAWWDNYRTWRKRESTKAMLRSLDDHTLRDIGLHRSEIASVVHDRTGERVIGRRRQV